MTLLERFFKNSASNITIYSIHCKQFNLAGCFSHKYFRILNHRCSNTLVLSISQMKSLKGTKKLELNWNVKFGRVVLSKSFISRSSKMRDKNHAILSSYSVPVEKVPFFISSRISYKQPLKLLQL